MSPHAARGLEGSGAAEALPHAALRSTVEAVKPAVISQNRNKQDRELNWIAELEHFRKL